MLAQHHYMRLRSMLRIACPRPVGNAQVVLDLFISRQPHQQRGDLIADASDGLIIHVSLCDELWHVCCEKLAK